MRKLWNLLGRISFWIGWPGLWFYLRNSHRTRVIIHCNGKILMEKTWLGDGKWILPGGGLHKGETSVDGAIREVQEEIGVRFKPEQLELHGTYPYHDKGFKFTYDLYSAELADMPPTRAQRGEITAIRWLALDTLGPDVHKEVLRAVQVWRG